MRWSTDRSSMRGGRYLLAVGAMMGAMASLPAVAQEQPGTSPSVEPPGGQMPARQADRDTLAIEQVGEARAHAIDTTQIAPAQPGQEAAQLTTPGAAAERTPQVYRGASSAEAAAPLSTRAEGRETAVTRLGGSDRCEQPDAQATRLCQQAIETRAGEFERPPPTQLSPEQRLLIDQRLRAAPRGVASAVDRVGTTSADANSTDAQELASITLARPGEPAQGGAGATDRKDPVSADAAGAAVIEAIVERVQGTPR